MTTPTLIAMNRNGGATSLQWRAQRSYYAEVPALALDEQGQLIEQVIRFAFDALGASYLDVRVLGARKESRRASEQSLTIGAPITPEAQSA